VVREVTVRVAGDGADDNQLRDAIREAGATVVECGAANVLVWTSGASESIRSYLTPAVEWIQLTSAGVEDWLPPISLMPAERGPQPRVFTAGQLPNT
jgi:hypothetical protein